MSVKGSKGDGYWAGWSGRHSHGALVVIMRRNLSFSAGGASSCSTKRASSFGSILNRTRSSRASWAAPGFEQKLCSRLTEELSGARDEFEILGHDSKIERFALFR